MKKKYLLLTFILTLLAQQQNIACKPRVSVIDLELQSLDTTSRLALSKLTNEVLETQREVESLKKNAILFVVSCMVYAFASEIYRNYLDYRQKQKKLTSEVKSACV